MGLRSCVDGYKSKIIAPVENVTYVRKIDVLLFVVPIGVLMVLTTVFENLTNRINSVFTGLLVVVTYTYVHFSMKQVEESKKTVEEMQKARKAEYIQKRLEMFYFPLLNVLSLDDYSQIHDSFSGLRKQLQTQINNLFQYTYLCDNITEDAFTSLRHTLNYGPVDKETIEDIGNLIDLVHCDIKELESELHKIIDA